LREKRRAVHAPVLETASSFELEDRGNPIDYDNTKVLNNQYVTVRGGIDSKEQPNQSATSVVQFEYGAKLDVIEITEDWLGVRERVLRKYTKNGRKIETTGWEKVYVPKVATGDVNEIRLIQTDLNVITSLTLKGKTLEYEEGKILRDYLEIELIDSSTFYLQKATGVDYLLADTTIIFKNNGVIKLPIKNGTKHFIDKHGEETENQAYSYLGQINFLNSYVLLGVYWESWDYKFINKTTGKQEMSFIDYPHISPHRKNIICISGNPYTSTADLELYVIENNKIKIIMAACFNKWMPATDKDNIYWSDDGFLYVPVLPVSTWGVADGVLKPERQYLRINVLPHDK
jgi:ribosomal protein S18